MAAVMRRMSRWRLLWWLRRPSVAGGCGCCGGVQLGEGAMFGGGGVGGGMGFGCTRRPRTDSRRTGTLLRFGSAFRYELGRWRWLVLLEVAGVLRSLSRSRHEE
jgi:hypothetical protein